MLDLKFIRSNPERVAASLKQRGNDLDLDQVLGLDERRRAILAESEQLKGERNTVSKQIGIRKKAGEDIEPVRAEMKALGDQITQMDEELKSVEEELHDLLIRIPNIPHESSPVGMTEDDNRFIREWGEKKTFDFQPRPHWDIASDLQLMDLERATKLSGAGFPLYTGAGARLQRALIQFMLDVHTQEHGYTEVLPPLMCTAAATQGTGQLPKLEEEMYYVSSDDLYLIPTGEVPVTNIYRDEIIEQDLPICLTTHTPCFRREAGAAGRDTRGIIRVHQFDKVEMVKFVEPETSYDELEKLLADAEDILQRLGLHYRVVQLCTGDLSFAAAKCYDIELWAPGFDGWLEVSSCSNFEDFQARRANIRYRGKDGKPAFLHTLNGSGVALARLVVAILENGQQADGSVMLPEAIHPYMGGLERISAPETP